MGYGVLISTSSNPAATIGGTLSGSGNVISGNGEGGIDLDSSGDNLILGNWIGTNLEGNAALGNDGDGITLSDSPNNSIGGTDAGAGNLISGNSGSGISISGSGSSGDLVFGNKIGTDTTGTLSLGNAESGIVISGASSIAIGSTVGTGGNLIAGNRQNGLEIESSSNNIVVANTIGGSTSSLGNAENGIELQNTFANIIGEPLETLNDTLNAGANFITKNGGDGIYVNYSSASTIGANVIVGNLVSSDTKNGIHVVGDFTADTLQVEILNNFVGTNPDGTSTYVLVDSAYVPQGNGLNGILLEESATSSGTTTSGIAALVSENVSSGNGLSGIAVQPYQTNTFTLARVSIEGNRVGTDFSGANTSLANSTGGGTLPFGNALDGILLNDVSQVTIGGFDRRQSHPRSPGRQSHLRQSRQALALMSTRGTRTPTSSTTI